MSRDILETFPNVQVIGYGVPKEVSPMLVRALQDYGLHLRTFDVFEDLADVLQSKGNMLLFVGLSSDPKQLDELSLLSSLINTKDSICVGCCLDDSQFPSMGAMLDSLPFSDVISDDTHPVLLQRKCASYLELLQRRSLSYREEQLITQMSYQKDRLLGVLPDGVLSLTAEGHISEINEAALESLGYGREDVVGAHVSQILCEPSSRDPLLDWCEHPIYSVITTQQNANVEDTGMWRSDGALLPVDCEVATLYPGQDPEFLIVFQDISIRKTEEEQLNQLTRYDPVTGLANVSLMRHFLLKAMARALRNDRRLAVLYIDLDDFHCINENFGMSGGNSLLKSVGRRLKNCIRTGDLVSRYQDDAFMVVLDEVRHDADVEKVAQQMMEKLSTPHDLSGVPVVAHASIGIAFYPQGSIGIDVLIEQATQAMQWVKHNGKNNLLVYSENKENSNPITNNSFVH